MKVDKASTKSEDNENLISKKEKGKVEMKENEGKNESTLNQRLQNPTESLMERKFSPIPIHKMSSSSFVSIGSIDNLDNYDNNFNFDNIYNNINSNNNNNNNDNNNRTVLSSPSSSLYTSSDSFNNFFNISSPLFENEKENENNTFLNHNKLYRNAYSNSSYSIKLRKNSIESVSGMEIENNLKERIPSKIQNFPPEILVKIFRYVRIIPKDKKKWKNQDQKQGSMEKNKLSTEASSSSMANSSTSTSATACSSSSSSSSSSKIKDHQSQNIINKNENENNTDNNNSGNNDNNNNVSSNTYEDFNYECGDAEMNSSSDEEDSKSSFSNSNAYNDVYNCIQVCRHWSHLAQKELYHTLSFNYTNIINSYLLLKIAASLEVLCKTEKTSPTRTIVLRVSHDGKVPDSKEWYDRKGELAFNMILRNCPNLKYIALFGVNFGNLTAEVISSVCTNVHQLLFIPFSVSNINERSLLHITEHCHSIRSLILSFFTFSSKAVIKKIFKNLESSLKNLDLIQVECEESDFDYIIPYLKNVEELGLMLTTSFTDSSLRLLNRHCPKLEYLNFTGLLNISDQGLENLFSREKDSAFMNENISSNAGDELLFSNSNASSSRNSGSSYSRGHRSKNSRVKRINLSDCMDITDEGLITISNNCEALEAISIDDCPRITDEGFEAFVKNQTKIKYLSIANSETLTNKAIECLNKYCPLIEKVSFPYI
eukprot:jgi/Orpsp1_1/1186700/evm.model.d7180000052628.1